MDRHIKEVLGHYLKESKISEGYTSERIEKIWIDKMGKSVAAQTKSIRFYKGEVNIHLLSSVLKYELFQNKDRIVEMLNEEIGAETVMSVKFK